MVRLHCRVNLRPELINYARRPNAARPLGNQVLHIHAHESTYFPWPLSHSGRAEQPRRRPHTAQKMRLFTISPATGSLPTPDLKTGGHRTNQKATTAVTELASKRQNESDISKSGSGVGAGKCARGNPQRNGGGALRRAS